MSNKDQKKAKNIRALHIAADKAGKASRKVRLWIVGIAIVTGVTIDKNNSNKA